MFFQTLKNQLSHQFLQKILAKILTNLIYICVTYNKMNRIGNSDKNINLSAENSGYVKESVSCKE